MLNINPHNSFKPLGAVGHGVVAEPAMRGWEVPGDLNNLTSSKPYVEGSWVLKRQGRYYWMYSSPGTQYKSYSDGVFTAQNLCGPWSYDLASPASSKSTGFLGGAGHSSTFKDFSGQSWHISTASIDVRDSSCGRFERRAALHPVQWWTETGGGTANAAANVTHISVDTYL